MNGRIIVTGKMIWKIDPRGRLELGRGVRIHSGHRVNGFGGQRHSIVWVLPGGQLSIGNNSGFSSSTLVCQHRLSIGKRVMIGGACDIFDTDYHPLDADARQTHDTTQIRVAPVTIEDDAWVGGNVTIMKGVVVGTGSVIGACSVVTKCIPAGEVWAGNPARFIRRVC